MRKLLGVLSAMGMLSLYQVSVSHADFLFMFIDGVRGETQDRAHLEWSDIQSATWGHGEAPPGSTVKLQFSRLTITKLNDSTSPLLAQSAAGFLKPFREVKLEAVTDSSRSQVRNRVKLTGAQVTRYETAAALANTPIDTISFSFETITLINFKYDGVGNLVPGNAACFDLKTNTACQPNF